MPLFSKNKKAPTTAESVTKLTEALELLDKREQALQKKIARQVEEAKACMAARNKKGALMCLKRKKTYEGEIEKIWDYKANLDTQLMTIQGAHVTLTTVQAMTVGRDALQNLNAQMSAQDVEKVMEDARNAYEDHQDIVAILSEPLGERYDEDELLAEFENELRMEKEEEDEDEIMRQINEPIKQRPQQQQKQRPQQQQQQKQQQPVDEEEEFAKLQAELA